jgi:peroxiredoxin Q/BCP
MADKRLGPGDPAPDFTLPDADGNQVSLSSLRGQRVIVYFYPAAMTPGCTKLARFRDKEGLTFPLLSDPDHAVLEAYGAFGEKKLYGKTTVGVIRSTFVIDADGTISKALYGVKATGHVARLRTEIGA